MTMSTAIDDLVVLVQCLANLLVSQSQYLCVAESCTGGGVAQALTQVPGASKWFDRGFVTYSNAAKHEMLGVAEQLLDTCGAVSEPVVMAMAHGALQNSQADLAIAVTGIAGPGGGSAGKPVGTVWFAWHSAHAREAQCQHLSGNREHIRKQAITIAVQGMLDRAAHG